MPHVIVLTPQTKVFTKLRQSVTWNVCLSSFSFSPCFSNTGTGAGATGVAGAGDGTGTGAVFAAVGTPGNAASAAPSSDCGLHFLKITDSWYRAIVWNFRTKT